MTVLDCARPLVNMFKGHFWHQIKIEAKKCLKFGVSSKSVKFVVQRDFEMGSSCALTDAYQTTIFLALNMT